MTDDTSDAAARRFARMSMTGLLEMWDEAMRESDRRLLATELEARGHRTASLEWPEPVEGAELFQRFPGPTREEFRAMGEDERMALPGPIWWFLQKRRFHLGLLLAGPVAFIAFCVVVAARPALREVEITIFSMAVNAVAYLVHVAFASVCYGLGPALDGAVPSGRRRAYRTWAYRVGSGLCCAVPFALPVLALLA